MASNRSRLERGRTDEVLHEILADFDTVMGWAFEECRRRWVESYAPDDMTGAPQEIGAFWSRNGRTEVDIVGVRKHRYVLVGTCRWRTTEGTDVLGNLRAQQAALGPKAARARLAIFARGGFTEDLRGEAVEDDVLLVTAADLFA